MKKIDLKRVLALAVILAFIVPVTMNAQGKPDFSGSWTLNAEKSTQPQGGQGGGGGMRAGGMGSNMTVKQDAASLSVERPGRNGGSPIVTKYTLDGKETVNESNFGSSKSTAKWSADGKALVITTTRTFERDGQSSTMTTNQEWTMNGTSLQVKSTFQSPNGERVTTMVYDKK